MAGGMGTRDGIPLGLRSALSGVGRTSPPRRHVWVRSPDSDEEKPGLILQWQQRDPGQWWALTVWVVDDDVAVQQWLPARLIRPID